jgi:hypothetical protein
LDIFAGLEEAMKLTGAIEIDASAVLIISAVLAFGRVAYLAGILLFNDFPWNSLFKLDVILCRIGANASYQVCSHRSADIRPPFCAGARVPHWDKFSATAWRLFPLDAPLS